MPFEMDLWEIKLATWNSPFFFFSLNAFESLTDKKGYIFKMIHIFKKQQHRTFSLRTRTIQHDIHKIHFFKISNRQ